MGKREAGVIYISLQLATDELRAGIRSLDNHFKKLGNSAQRIGQQMSLAFTLPIATLGRSATRSFAEFDQAMANSLAFMGKVSDGMKKELIEGARQISVTTELSAAQAASGYGALAQAGLDVKQSLEALPVVADFATAGQMRLADATTTLVQIQKSMGMSSDDASENALQLAKVADIVTRASIDTTLSIEDLSGALASQLGGQLRMANVSLETAGAMLQSFGSQGIKGAKAGTALGIVIRELGIDFLKHSAAFKKAGIAVFDAQGNYKNMIGVIGALEDKLKGLSKAQQIAQIMDLGFTKKNAGFIQALVGTSEQMKIWEERNKSATGEMRVMAAAMRDTFQAKMQMAKNSIQNVGIVLGSQLAPAILAVTQGIAILATLFTRLDPTIQKVVLGFAAFAALAGPLMFVWGIFLKGLGSAIALAGMLLKPLMAIGTAVSVLAGIFGTLPLAIAAAFVGGAAVAAIFWDELKGLGQAFIDWFAGTFPELTVVMQATWILMKEIAIEAWNIIGDVVKQFIEWFAGAGNFLVDVAVEIWKMVADAATVAWEGVKIAVDAFITGFAVTFPNITKTASTTWGIVRDIALAAIDEIIYAVETLIGYIEKIFKALGDAKDWVVGKSKEIVDEAATNAAAQAVAAQAKAQINANAAAKESFSITGKINELWKSVVGAIPKATAETVKNTGAVGNNTDALGENAESLEETLKGFEGVDKSAKKAGNAIEQLNKKLSDAKTKTIGKDLEEQLGDAVENLDKGAFDQLRASLAESIKKGSAEGLQDLVNKAGKANKEVAAGIVSEIGDAKAEKALNEWEAKWADSARKNAEKHAEELEKAHEKAVGHWREAFGTALEGGVFDFEAALKELLVGFAAELAAAVTGGMSEGIKSIGDIGGLIGTAITGGAGGSGAGGGSTIGAVGGAIGGYFGNGGSINSSGGVGSSAYGPQTQGEAAASADAANASANAGYIQGAATVIGAGLSAEDTDQANKDNSGTGGAVGAAAGAIVGSFFGPLGTMIGAQLGQLVGSFAGSFLKWGSQNPETQARHAFANFVEEGFAKLKTVAFYDAQGKLELFKGDQLNFVEGGSNAAINDGSWADKFNAMGDAARGTFLGLGESLEELLGLTEDVGAQIGFMLAENLGGNIDNARLFVQQLGLSMDELVDKLVEVGRTGEMSWLEVETGIQGVTEAFKPGLVAIGDVKGAFQTLAESGGRGVAALKAVRDIAVEGMEAGLTSLEQLKQKMLSDGINPEEVDAFFRALAQRGITTMEQLAEVSDRVGGGIVADIHAGSESMARTWETMSAQLDDVSQKLKDLPTEIESNITLNVTANMDDDARAVINSGTAPGLDVPGASSAKKFAKGGLIGRSTFFNTGRGLGLAGEAGPEFLMPAQMMSDGTLGVRAMGGKGMGGGTTIIVNAPNATPGMEHKIADAIRKMGDRAVAQAVDTVERRQARGGRY